MLLVPAPAYSLAQAAWIPRLLIWRDDGTFDRREGQPCESWVAAMEASWRLSPSSRRQAEQTPSFRSGARSDRGHQARSARRPRCQFHAMPCRAMSLL
jgi:hypothetical protein